MENDETNEENKVKQIFMSTIVTILILLISLSYGMTWGILFVVYTKSELSKPDYDESCTNLLSWDEALYIVHFISAGIHIFSSVFQIIATSYNKESSIPTYITGCRSCANYIVGMVILFGINVSYFSHEDISKCGDLQELNLAYLITEWTILGSCICLVCCVCIISIVFKKKKRHERKKKKRKT